MGVDVTKVPCPLNPPKVPESGLVDKQVDAFLKGTLGQPKLDTENVCCPPEATGAEDEEGGKKFLDVVDDCVAGCGVVGRESESFTFTDAMKKVSLVHQTELHGLVDTSGKPTCWYANNLH